jgi:4-hydroxybenzoate polyprenyltransferase
MSVIMRSNNPIVTGELTLREAQLMNWITAALAVGTSFFAGISWTGLIVIGIGLVILYDVSPFRFKDRPFGVMIPALYLALPFVFGYVNSSATLSFPPSFLFIVAFLFVNGLTVIRHVPDLDRDREMGVHNFTAHFGVYATQLLELTVSVTLMVVLASAILVGSLSVFGLPLLLVTTVVKIGVLLKSQEAFQNPVVWRRFAQIMVLNSVAILLSITGRTWSL